MSAPSLHALLSARRDDLLSRWKEWVRREVTALEMPAGELVDSMPLFIDALIQALRPGPSDDDAPPAENTSARVHGSERLRQGFDVAAVVREYNLLRRAVLDLAEADGLALGPGEYRTLSDSVGDAQTLAVTEYQRGRDEEQKRQAANHLAFLAHELRNPLSNALMAFALLRNQIPVEKAKQAALLNRALMTVSELLDETLVVGRLSTGGVLAKKEPVRLAVCAREVAEEHAAAAEHAGMRLQAEIVDELGIQADPRLLRSVLSNLVGNAIKFSRPGSVIILRARRLDQTVVVEVEDGCGGLPSDKVSAIFDPHVQIGADRSGFGLGLAIAKQAAEAHGGSLQVQNLEGKGCCFRLELPSG
jgi:signal transduction histidine kinase